MKNLLILVPTLQLGGQERIAAMTADLMAGTYNVILVVFDGSDAVYSTSCKTVDIGIPALPGTVNKIINVFKRVKAVNALKKRLQTDIVYSFGSTANIVNCLLPGVRHLAALHGYGSTTFMEWEKILYKRADILCCVSKRIKQTIDEKYSFLCSKTAVLYNPYDIEMMKEKARDIVDDYKFSSYTVISHGRLDEVKNWPRLIKAFSLVREKIAEAQLLIIGEGSQRQELERLIGKYDLQNSVTLLGFRNNPYAYLIHAAVYVLSSYSEGFPNALVEGMAFLPVVSVDCRSGPREILSNGSIDTAASGYEIEDYGILVQPAYDRKQHDEITDDDRILADAILKVLLDPKLAGILKEASQKRAEEFSCSRYTERLTEIVKAMHT